MRTHGTLTADRLEQLDASAFSGRRLDRRGTWAVLFHAEWCGFCRRFAPMFATLGSDHAHLAIGDVTSDSSPLWDDFAIELVPTVIVFRDGAAVARFDARPSEGLGPDDIERMRAVLLSG